MLMVSVAAYAADKKKETGAKYQCRAKTKYS